MKSFYIDSIPKTHKDVVSAVDGYISDKIASITVQENNLVLQCDEYVLHIHRNNDSEEYLVDSNCDGEMYNTMSAAILANEHFKIKNNDPVTKIINELDNELASYILSVLVYDVNLYLRARKQMI